MVSCCFWFHGRGFSDPRIGCSFSADGSNNKARASQKRRASDVQHCRAGTAGVKRRRACEKTFRFFTRPFCLYLFLT